MLSVRAAFEEKLKQKGVFITLEPNTQRTQKQKLRLHNSQLETFDDFGDDPLDVDGMNTRDLSNGKASLLLKKVSHIVTAKGNKNKVSGDDDLPLRDDLGERRRKHKLRALASAGANPTDDGDAEDELGGRDLKTITEEKYAL